MHSDLAKTVYAVIHAALTLIELMVTLAVAGILLTIAVPSFQEFIASNRISTEANG